MITRNKITNELKQINYFFNITQRNPQKGSVVGSSNVAAVADVADVADVNDDLPVSIKKFVDDKSDCMRLEWKTGVETALKNTKPNNLRQIKK